MSTVNVRDVGRRVDVAGHVDRAHLEGVRAVGQRRRWCVGEVHDAHAPPSTRHSKVEPASLDENANVGVESLVEPDGPLSIVVTGGTVSASPA